MVEEELDSAVDRVDKRKGDGVWIVVFFGWGLGLMMYLSSVFVTVVLRSVGVMVRPASRESM